MTMERCRPPAVRGRSRRRPTEGFATTGRCHECETR
jgi:hypothetical protein